MHIDSAETTTTTSGCSQKTVNLAAYAGQTITLAFTGTEDALP
jgi:hypothetical protein